MPALEWEGKVASATLTCSITGRPLAPGETIWSALVLEGQDFRRRDFSPEAWLSADRTGLLSWWRHAVPLPDPRKRQVRLDADLLAKLFEDLKGSRERPQQCLCFVIALCLVRAKAWRLESAGDGHLIVEQKADRVRLRIRDPGMAPTEQDQVQNALLGIIGVEG